MKIHYIYAWRWMVPSDGILVKGVDLQSKYNFELDEETGRLTGLINEGGIDIERQQLEVRQLCWIVVSYFTHLDCW